MSTQETVPTGLSAVARNWWVFLLYGAFAVLFGLYALARPLGAAAAMTWALGVLALAEGLLGLFGLFSGNRQGSKGWLVLYALLSLAFGGLAVFAPLAMANSMILVLAAWLLVAGIYRIVFAIRARKLIPNEWLLALSGVLAIVLGVMFALNTAAGLLVTTLWVGALFLVYGIFQVIGAFRLRKLK